LGAEVIGGEGVARGGSAQPGALTVLGELEGVSSLVEEVGGVLVLGAEDAPARELLLRLLLEVVPTSLVVAHRRRRRDRCFCPAGRRRGERPEEEKGERRGGEGNGAHPRGGVGCVQSVGGSGVSVCFVVRSVDGVGVLGRSGVCWVPSVGPAAQSSFLHVTRRQRDTRGG